MARIARRVLGKPTPDGGYAGVMPDVSRFIAGRLGVPLTIVRYLIVEYVYIAAPNRTFADVAAVDRPGVKIGLPGLAAKLLRIDALRTGAVDVYADNGLAAAEVVGEVPGTSIVRGTFTTLAFGYALQKGRSAAARSRRAFVVREAVTSGVVTSAIERAALKGVRAPD